MSKRPAIAGELISAMRDEAGRPPSRVSPHAKLTLSQQIRQRTGDGATLFEKALDIMHFDLGDDPKPTLQLQLFRVQMMALTWLGNYGWGRPGQIPSPKGEDSPAVAAVSRLLVLFDPDPTHQPLAA